MKRVLRIEVWKCNPYSRLEIVKNKNKIFYQCFATKWKYNILHMNFPNQCENWIKLQWNDNLGVIKLQLIKNSEVPSCIQKEFRFESICEATWVENKIVSFHFSNSWSRFQLICNLKKNEGKGEKLDSNLQNPDRMLPGK